MRSAVPFAHCYWLCACTVNKQQFWLFFCAHTQCDTSNIINIWLTDGCISSGHCCLGVVGVWSVLQWQCSHQLTHWHFITVLIISGLTDHQSLIEYHKAIIDCEKIRVWHSNSVLCVVASFFQAAANYESIIETEGFPPTTEYIWILGSSYDLSNGRMHCDLFTPPWLADLCNCCICHLFCPSTNTLTYVDQTWLA